MSRAPGRAHDTVAGRPSLFIMSTVDIAESEQPRLIATNIVIVVLACISVVLRVLARRITGLGLDLDDYIIFVALFVLFAAFALALLGQFSVDNSAGASRLMLL